MCNIEAAVSRRMMVKKVLITGAAGRIGSTLTTGLHPSFDLRLTDLLKPAYLPAGVEFIAADITDPAAMAMCCTGMDAVIHLAGHPNSRNWEVVERLNIQGTRTVLEAAVAARVARLIYASSIHAVGLYDAETPLTGHLGLRPDSPYGVSKAYGEVLLRYLCETRGVTGISLRICSFRYEPGNARELTTWLSPADMVRLAAACLDTTQSGYQVIVGASANSRAQFDRDAWLSIGYHPLDDAECFAQALSDRGVDTSLVSEFPLHGGDFAT